jgi:ATP-dependent Clp protease ATP-binding subunit ClpC
MFERFTDGARRSVILAQDEARRLDHNYIGTEHLLLALLREEESAAAQALADVGLTLAVARRSVEGVVGRGHAPPLSRIPFTPHAKKALECSLRASLELGDRHIDTAHLLLGLLNCGEGMAARMVADAAGGDVDVVRRKLRERISAG